MKIMKVSLTPANIQKGEKVKLFLHDLISESEEERRRMAEMREEAACAEEDHEGEKIIHYRPLIIEEPPLGKCIAVPRGPKSTGEEWFSLFTPQAVDIFMEGKFGTGSPENLKFEPIVSSLSPNAGGYGCSSGYVNGKPSLIIVSPDWQRALILLSRRVVIEKVLDRILGRTSDGPGIAVYTQDDRQYLQEWNLCVKRAESLTIEVKTFEQALNALIRYRPYLNDVVSDEGGNGPHTQTNEPTPLNPTLRRPRAEPSVN